MALNKRLPFKKEGAIRAMRLKVSEGIKEKKSRPGPGRWLQNWTATYKRMLKNFSPV
jgi:uncharacterized protein YcnI